MPKLLLWSDSVCAATGFGRVARTICAALPDWDITQVGLNHLEELDHFYGCVNIHPTTSEDPWGLSIARKLYLENDYDLFIVIQDLHASSPWAEEFTAARISRSLRALPYTPTIYHYPVDGPMLGDVDFVKFADHAIACTQWGADLIKPLLRGREADVIPHAVDTRMYRPVPPRAKAALRESIFGIAPDDDTLAVLSVGVNTDRKDHFSALAAIKELNQAQLRGKLYIHTKAIANSIDIHCQGRSLGLSPLEYRVADASVLGCSDSAMNKLYNAADCLLFTSRREGFGIPMIEALAAGIPVLAPNYGPFVEVLARGSFGYLHEPSGLVWIRGDNRGPGWQSDPSVIARHLGFLRAARIEVGSERSAWARVHVEENYSLAAVIPMWQRYIQEILHGS